MFARYNVDEMKNNGRKEFDPPSYVTRNNRGGDETLGRGLSRVPVISQVQLSHKIHSLPSCYHYQELSGGNWVNESDCFVQITSAAGELETQKDPERGIGLNSQGEDAPRPRVTAVARPRFEYELRVFPPRAARPPVFSVFAAFDIHECFAHRFNEIKQERIDT